MPSVTHDGRSLMVDGKRVWLVSGRVPYARVARANWAERIAQAKAAGLNTIETPLVWARHESRPGRFDFTGENDLRHFVDLVGKAGMYCILGVGPYVGAEWDMGGLPPFLHELAPREGVPIAFRTNNPQFLEACARFIGAVADQIRGWQVTAQGTGGPIILLQCESEWTCGHEALANSYLGELTRYIRESGLSVPIVNSNDLWQTVEGQIDGWSGSDNMLPTMRQLASVRPGQPRIVVDFATGHHDVWGQEPAPTMSARAVERRLAEAAVAGSQYNLTAFCGGTNPGFVAGRTDDGPGTFATHASDRGCAIDQTGASTDLLPGVRRISHVCSRFARVFSALDPAYQPVVEKPAPPGTSQKGGTSRSGVPARGPAGLRTDFAHISIVHAFGAQGGIVMVFGPEEEHKAQLSTTLVLPDGTEMDVPLGTQPVACCLLDVNVHPRAHLDYCNVTPMGVSGSVLVAYGPAGARALLSVNGSPVEATIPVGQQPTIVVHEGLAIVLVRYQDTDRVTLGEDGVLIGVSGFGADGHPIASEPGAKQYLRIGGDGKLRTLAFESARSAGSGRQGQKTVAKPRTPRLSIVEGWSSADQRDYVLGESARYAGISRLTDMSQLGSPSGYGWYRFTLSEQKSRRAVFDPGLGGDRFHVYQAGKLATVLGVGPGAIPQAALGVKQGQTLVVLGENLGRFSSGINLGEKKGLIEDLFEVEPVRLGKPALRMGTPVPVLAFRAPIWDVSEGDTTVPQRMVYSFKADGSKDRLLLRLSKLPAAGLILLNDKPAAFVDRSGPSAIMLSEGLLKKGANTLELSVMSPDMVEDGQLERAAKAMELFRITGGLAEGADIAFAKWEPPAPALFSPLRGAGKGPGLPTWYRCTFALDQAEGLAGVWVEPLGMTKGQIYVNGRHAGRYFVATRDGKRVPPQDRYFLPAGLLARDGSNELMLFDEHGATPSRVRILPVASPQS